MILTGRILIILDSLESKDFNLINVLYFIFSSKNNFNAVIKKIFIKLFDIKSFLYKNKNLDLLKKNSIQMNSFLENINSELNKESVNISKFIKFAIVS